MRIAFALILAACSKDATPPAPAPPPAKPAKPAIAAPKHVTTGQSKSPDDPWPIGSFALDVEVPTAIGPGDAIGTAHRVIRTIPDPKQRWAIVCQQRRDTDGDGKIRFEQEMHFALGDTPSAYLVIGGGPGIEVSDVIATSPTGDHLVVAIDAAVILIDVAHRTGLVLASAVDAEFSPDGTQLAYVVEADQHRKAVRRTLATGAETSIDLPAAGRLAGVRPYENRWTVVALWDYGVDGLRPYDEWCDLGGSIDRDRTTKPRFLWLDFDSLTLVENTMLVRPVGAHLLARTPSGLALDGVAIGPQRCKELDIIGVYPPSGMTLTQCYDSPQRIEVAAPNVKPFKISRVVERTFEPIPHTLPGPTYCIPWADCIDLTTGALTKRTAPDPHAPPEALVEGPHEMGPLHWAKPK